jgi:hypothetical protein
MVGKNASVFGIYPTHAGVEGGVQSLKQAGFRPTDISILFRENGRNEEYTAERGSKLPEGATAGGGSGAVIGGALGWLAGIGALTIPGFGALIAAGPMVAALAGIGAGGVVGAVTGALIGLGIPEFEAKRYEGRMKKGGILLSVHADDAAWAKRAFEILRQTGAEDVSTALEASTDTDDPAPPLRRTASTRGSKP